MAHPVVKRFSDNANGFWRAHLWILVIFFLALLADGLSTVHFMLQTSPEMELHPAVCFVSRILGPIAGPLVSVLAKAAAGIIVAIYLRRISWAIFLAVSIVSVWAAWYNFCGWQYYTPGILRWWPM
jgi:hypothetical protein